jgi:hypothetical protein
MSTIYNYELSPTLILRARAPGHNCSGSLLLQYDGTVWDCVECKEYSVPKYTEENWQEKYEKLYGGMMMVTNQQQTRTYGGVDDSEFDYTDLRGSSSAVIDSNQCRLSKGEVSVVYWDWDSVIGMLEMQVTEDVEGNKCTVGHTEYTSLLLRFDPVLFVEPVVGFKRRI